MLESPFTEFVLITKRGEMYVPLNSSQTRGTSLDDVFEPSGPAHRRDAARGMRYEEDLLST